MKRSYFILAGVLAVLLLGAGIKAHAADPDILYVRYIEGSVGLAEAGSAQTMDAVVNTPLIEGDTVVTGRSGKAELFLKDGSLVRIGEDSVMRVTAVADDGVQFKLEHGSAYIISQGSREVPLFLDTPLTALDIASPSTVRVDAYGNGVDEISVLKGSIFASRQASGRMLVGQGQRLVVKADGSIPGVARLRTPDDWTRWNIVRDGGATANPGTSESYAYLPEELRTYSSDLDRNGQWIYTPEYDYVWVPTVVIAGAWSPYRYGRWAWVRGSYVWIGYEPWGWAPYHYGRWIHHRQAGWCWVPPRHRDVRWEPAHVAWIHSSRNVSWVPLAPGERYDRRSAPVINQVNIYKTTYKNVTIERSAAQAGAAYRNASVANSMVTVERDRMLHQKVMPVAAPKPGPAMFKKVSLPQSVTPARVHAGKPDRQISERNASLPAARSAGTQPPVPLSKDTLGNSPAHAPVNPVSKPSVGTRQLSDTSLNSRIENARVSDRYNPARSPSPQPTVSSRGINGPERDVSSSDTLARDAQHAVNAGIQPVPKKEGVPEVRKTPASQPFQAVVPLRERIQANPPSPAVKAEMKPGTPREPGQRFDPAGTPPPPAPATTKAAPQRGARGNIPQAAATPARGVNGVEKAAPGGPVPVRTIPGEPRVKEAVPEFKTSGAKPAPQANQTARPAPVQGRPAPVVSAPRGPARTPEEARPPVRVEPAKTPASHSVNGQRPAPSRPAAEPPQSVPRPAPQAASPEKPAPVPEQPAKNDARPGPDKSKPHA